MRLTNWLAGLRGPFLFPRSRRPARHKRRTPLPLAALVEPLEDRLLLDGITLQPGQQFLAAGESVLVTGPGAGQNALVRVFNAQTGLERFSFSAFPGDVQVRVAAGDVNGDAYADVIVATGPEPVDKPDPVGPVVRVLSGRDGVELMRFDAYSPAWLGGVYVAAGDINGDGKDDIITGADAGGGPHVRTFSGADPSGQTLLRDFHAYDPAFRGGVRVAAGDVDGDGRADLVTLQGPNTDPAAPTELRVFRGTDGVLLGNFAAFGGWTGGAFVAAGDVNADGRADILAGADAGGGPHVRIFSGADLSGQTLLRDFHAYDPAFRGGVRVAAADANRNGRADLVTGAGPGGDPRVQVFDGTGNGSTALYHVFAYDMAFTGGVFVGADRPAATAAAVEGSPLTVALRDGSFPYTTVTQWEVDWGDGQIETFAGSATSATHAYADNGTYTVRRTWDDASGNVQAEPIIVTVSNAAPTATLSHSGPVGEGSPATVSFNDMFDPSSADVTADLRYFFSTSQVARNAATYATSGFATSQAFTFADNGTYTVYARVLDKDGGDTDYQTTVTATNVAPTATFSHNGPADEGSPVLVSFAGASDPSSPDTAAELRYTYALSEADLADSYATAADGPSTSFTFNDNGTYTVWGRVFDKDGGSTTYSTVVTVHNVAPSPSITGIGAARQEGTAVTVTADASDPAGAQDTLSDS